MRPMEKAGGRQPHAISLALLFACVVLAWSPETFALDPKLDVSQYAHTSWKIRDGFPKGDLGAIAQTRDGYLWLGTESGLFRFDGVKSVLWHPPANQELPSNWIFSLLVTRDGTLWIGTEKGLASWKDGKLTQFPELADRYLFKLLEDHEGTVWASGMAVSTEGSAQFATAASSVSETTAVLVAERSIYTRTAREISGPE